MPERQWPMICNNTNDFAEFTLQWFNKQENVNDQLKKIIKPKDCYTTKTGNEIKINWYETTMYTDVQNSTYAWKASSNCSSTTGEIEKGQALVVSNGNNDFISFYCEKMPIKKALELISSSKTQTTQRTKQKLDFMQPLRQKQAQEPINSMYAEALKDLGFNPNASASLCKILKD